MRNFLFRSLSEYTYVVYGRVRLVQLMKNFWQAQTGNFALFLVILPEMSEQPYFGQRGGERRVHEMTVNDNEGEGRVPEMSTWSRGHLTEIFGGGGPGMTTWLLEGVGQMNSFDNVEYG